MSNTTKRFVLAEYPKGEITESTYKLTEAPVPAVGDDEIRVKTSIWSVDPYLRLWLQKLPLGQPVVSGQVGEIVESKASGYKVGDKVNFYGAWAQEQVVNVKNEALRLRKVDDSVPLSLYIGILGMPGHTAWCGLHEAAQFKKGDIVLVSGAAGAVGSLVGQLAKQGGAKLVVGTAGGPEKCKLLTDKYGFDAAIDYKQFATQEAVAAELKRLSPDGFDVYFDNTGGHVSDAFYDVVRKFGRAAICGSIANYNDSYDKSNKLTQPLLWTKLIYTSVSIKGFIVFDYAAETPKADKELTKLFKDGKIKYEETFSNGFETLPQSLIGLFHGKNSGKMVVRA